MASSVNTGDSNIFRNKDKKPLRPGHILKSQGSEIKEIDTGIAGDIITLSKVEELKPADLISDGTLKGSFDFPETPEPMYDHNAVSLKLVAYLEKQKANAQEHNDGELAEQVGQMLRIVG